MIGLFTKNFQCLCLLSFAVACSAPVSNKTIKTVVKPSVQIEVASDRDNSNDFCEKILSGDAWARWANLLIDTYGLPERCQTITGDGHRNLDGPIIGTVTMPWDEFIYVFEAMPPETTIRTLVITKPSKKIDDWISKNRNSLLLESIKMTRTLLKISVLSAPLKISMLFILLRETPQVESRAFSLHWRFS